MQTQQYHRKREIATVFEYIFPYSNSEPLSAIRTVETVRTAMYQPGFAAAFPGCEQLSETAAGCTAPWEFLPSEVLSELPPLLESVAGRKYHYPPAFHRLLWLLSKGLNVILIARSTEVVAYGSCGCRDFIPAAGLTFSRCCYSVVKILRDLDRSFFPFTL